jgi:hypothetical protein
MSMQGWEYWSDAMLVHTSQDGSRVFAKGGYECHCPPDTEPGDADTDVCKAGLWRWAD